MLMIDNIDCGIIMVKDADKAPDIRNEYVLQVKGTVSLREQPNTKIATGKMYLLAFSYAELAW